VASGKASTRVTNGSVQCHLDGCGSPRRPSPPQKEKRSGGHPRNPRYGPAALHLRCRAEFWLWIAYVDQSVSSAPSRCAEIRTRSGGHPEPGILQRRTGGPPPPADRCGPFTCALSTTRNWSVLRGGCYQAKANHGGGNGPLLWELSGVNVVSGARVLGKCQVPRLRCASLGMTLVGMMLVVGSLVVLED